MTPDRVDKHKRIDLIRELRVGWGASTNLGVNAETHEHVVVRKLDLSVTRPWSWDWLTHELETMASSQLLHHVTTKIVRKSADEAVLVRPVVAGRDILEWAAHEPRPSIDTYLRVMCDLLFALAQLHSMGIAHGGLKPANIMLTESGHLILLDASITRTQLAATTYPVNSADGRYLPPEHAGRLHRTVGFAADIFAAGWVLLEAAAERNRTASALRSGADGRDMTPEGLAHLVDVVGVPPALRPVILKLLSPLREHRYESAEDALAAVEAVLATSIGEAGLVPTASTAIGGSLAYLEPPLVGRRAELDTLNFYVERATRPTRAVLCMSGESGLGKSRLLDAVAIHANAMGVTVLRGGAFEYAAQRPLGLFAEPFRDIVTYLRAHPGEADRMRREMGELLGPAIELIPGLAGVFADLPTTDVAGLALDDGSAAAAPTAAIARLLQGVFTKARPGLLMLDDCQWADDLSWQVLAKVASETSRGAGSPVYVSLICSCRPEAVAQVKSWDVDGIDFLELEPLSSSDTEELVRSIDNHIPDEIVPYVIRYSGGNPMETLSVFRALIDSSALTREAGRWVVNEDEMRSLPVLSQPRSLDASGMREGTRTDVFVSARLDLLSANTQQAMRQGAILGRQFPSPLLCGALGASAEDVRYLLREGMERGIIRRVAGVGAENFEFTHDRLREAVLRSLTEEQRRDTHRRAAQALEGSAEGQSDYEIAYHLNRSGQVAAAMPYALRAGEAGLRQHALDVAESNFEIAEAGLQLLQSIGDREKFRVYEGLGTVHMLLASYDLAAEKLTRAHEIAQALPGLESARVATLLGELAFKTGRFEDAAAWMQQGMQHLGLRVPGRPLAAAASSLGEVAILALGWVSRRIRPTRANAGTERDRLAARIYDRLAYEWWFVRSPIWVRWAILRGVRFANAGGSTRERSHAYSMAAAIISGTAPILAPVSLRLAVRSLRLCQAAKDDWGVAHAQHFRGFVLLAAARYDEAIESLDASITAFDTVGDRWEQIAAMWQKALCLFRLGMLHEAGVLARETYREGKRIGDRIGAGTALAIWVRCLPADVSVETLSRELRRTNSDDHHTTAMLQAARGWRLFHSDEYEQAVDAFRQADELLRHSGIRNHFVAPITTWHLQVLRLMHDAAPAWWAGERRNRAKAARRQLARALRSAIIFRGERPTVLREWAMMSFAEGHSWRGRLILRAATRSAVNAAAGGDLAACSSVEELAWIKLRRGSLGQLPPARELCRRLAIRVDRGIAEAVPSGVMPTGGDSSRHRSLLDAVGRIVASDDVEEVLAKLREATMATTSARRVEISRLPESVGPGGVPNGSPGASLGEPIVTGEAARGMKMTERIAKPVVADGHNASSVVAAFPLGEGHYHEPTVEVLAALAGAVIEREKLRRRSMEWIVDVQEAERGRIARDLHDEFGHLFAGITEGLSALEKVGDEATRRVTMDVRKIVRQGIQAARVGAWSLRPSGLDDLSLPGCVEQLVEDCRQMFPLRIELTATGHAGPIPPSVETAVFRIVQEALTNIDRHSRAAAASVVLVCSGHTVRAVVEDDGIGFDVDVSGQSGSLGLIGMRERARLVRGRLTVDSQPGQGTIVMVEVPIRR